MQKSVSSISRLAGPLDGGRTVLIAVDDDREHSKHAFNWYFENLHRNENLVVIAHVPESPALPSVSLKHDGLHVPFEEWKKVMEDSIKKVDKMQADIETDLVARRARYKMVGEHRKNVAEGIILAAEENNADYIVVGTRSLGAIKRTVLGSVSDNIVHHSPVPVLVVPFMRKGDSRRESLESSASSPKR
jgi:nucleotide-binding universal stress UspA family protein